MVYVTKTYLPDKEKYKSYIDRIYHSGWVTNRGELVIELEKRLAELFGVRHVILVSNGTLALQVVYKAMGLTGEVITTPFSFVATTSSLVWEGLKPVFADIDPASWVIDPKKVESKITPETTAIVAVHVFGNPCDMDALQEMSNKYGLKLIYDAAHAFLVTYKGTNVAQFGDASTFSFHATKIFHTIEGGAIVVNDDGLAEKIRLMINFGIAGYDSITELGINAKMNEFQAAMGLCMLDEICANIESRKHIFEYYHHTFAGHPNIQLQQINPMTRINYTYFPIVLSSEEKLLSLIDSLNKKNIFPRRYFYPSLEKLPYLQVSSNMKVSSCIAKRVLCLPIYEDLKVEQVNAIADIVMKHMLTTN